VTATCEYGVFNVYDPDFYEEFCDDKAAGYFDGFFYCEFHARHLGKVR
jgi:hypothetical protein